MKRILALAILVAAAISCCQKDAERKADHVFVIAFDGWGSYCMDSVSMPNTRSLMEAGTYTFYKRTVLPSDSAPNWASMFAGAPNEFHGWSNNGSGPDVQPVYLNKNGVFPTIFSILREQDPEAEIGCIFEWGGIRPLIDENAHNYCVKEKQENLTPLAVEYIKTKKPDFLTVIYDDPDHVGHADGHDTPAYYAKMEQLDSWLGEIIAAIKEAGIYDDSIIVVTSDHGGINTSHGGRSLMEMDTPFIVAGKNIRKAGDLNQYMMQYDTAHTLAEMFGLEIPEVWRGKSLSQIFE
jgi:predicted AlkP superfamily pyrophosphatase or phosphodiesterase